VCPHDAASNVRCLIVFPKSGPTAIGPSGTYAECPLLGLAVPERIVANPPIRALQVSKAQCQLIVSKLGPTAIKWQKRAAACIAADIQGCWPAGQYLAAIDAMAILLTRNPEYFWARSSVMAEQERQAKVERDAIKNGEKP
jgi:hypothetical protein